VLLCVGSVGNVANHALPFSSTEVVTGELAEHWDKVLYNFREKGIIVETQAVMVVEWKGRVPANYLIY